MPVLKSLTFTARRKTASDPARTRRAKCVSKLEEQKVLLRYPNQVRIVQRWTKVNGERRAVTKQQADRPWWKAGMSVKFGALSVALLLALAGCFIAGPCGLAYAQNQPDQCDDVLKGDLQNKISSSSQQTQSTLQFAAATFFSETESQAFSDYQNEASKIDFSKLGESDQAHVDAHYGLIGGAVDFAHSYNHELSANEFHDEWNKHQAEYKQSTGQTSTTSSSGASSIASAYDDPRCDYDRGLEGLHDQEIAAGRHNCPWISG